MPADPPRIISEKSRTVRRRYQRSNKRFQFTPSQIERIEREEERERRAQKLREKEKKRIANKKKRAEKEAKEREERRRQGPLDPDAPTVPSSQPLLFNFLKKGKGKEVPPLPVRLETLQEETEADTEVDTPGSSLGGDSVNEDEFEGGSGVEDEGWDDTLLAQCAEIEAEAVEGEASTEYSGGGVLEKIEEPEKRPEPENDDDEFSDCSIFYDEDIIKEAETRATGRDTSIATAAAIAKEPEEPAPAPVPVPPPPRERRAPRSFLRVESFRDETADLLEEFAHELLDAEEGSGRGQLVRRNGG